MEYVITNKEIKGYRQFGKLFYHGDIVVTGHDLFLIDGFVVKSEKQSLDQVRTIIKDDNINGAFNCFLYNKEQDILYVKNDKIAQNALYLFWKDSTFFLSNSFWKIIQNLDENEIEFDIKNVKSYLLSLQITSESETLFKNIIQYPAATVLNINLRTNKFESYRYWEMKQQEEQKISIDEAVFQLDNDITNLFKYLKENYSEDVFGFGNSGGLDSRLIPAYAKKVGLNVEGFIIGNSHPMGIRAISHMQAQKIANLYEIKHREVHFMPGDIEKQQLLDIRNNPFGTNELMKNPYDKLNWFDKMLCGGNGFVISNDSGLWNKYEELKTLEEKRSFLINYISKKNHVGHSIKHLNIILSYFFRNTAFSSRDAANYYSLFSTEDIIQNDNMIDDFLYKYNHLDNLSQIRTFHQLIRNFRSPQGGYESINRTKKTFYLYYPFALDNTLKWENNYFYNRTILKKLLLHKDKRLAKLHDQTMHTIDGRNSRIKKIANYAFRKTGMDYYLWFNNNVFSSFYWNVILRKNVLFNEYFKVDNVMNIKPMNHNVSISLGILKLKLIFDIIYYKEFDFIDEEDFNIK